jgi:hypothetical protein
MWEIFPPFFCSNCFLFSGSNEILRKYFRTTGGSCTGGDSLKAYEFINKYGISDDTCAPFLGLNWARGFEVAGMTDVEEVRAHQCYLCMWSGTCTFVQR